MHSFPIYIANLSGKNCVLYPINFRDCGHVEFWENYVHKIVGTHYYIPWNKLVNIPYCQLRARWVECDKAIVYCGEEVRMVKAIMDEEFGKNRGLVFIQDKHEKRLKYDVKQFEKLKKRYAVC